MSGAFLRRRDRTARPPRVEHYSSAVNNALVAFFAEPRMDVTRICLEAGPLSQWLYEGLAEAGLPVVCAETRCASIRSAAV